MKPLLTLAVFLLLVGCSAADATSTPVSGPPTISASPNVPSDGVELRALGFDNAPAGFSIPAGAEISQRVDQRNTVVVVMTAPTGLEVAAYLRRELPTQGYEITADANNSLLFEQDGIDGAFTVNGAYSAISLRYDERS